MARFLVTFGIALVIAGLAWPFLSRIGLGRLPGDVVIERDNFRFYFPIATSILISLVVSVLLYFFRQ